jgi:hypothetical protein
LIEAARNGASNHALAELITDSMVDALFVAGDAGHCLEQLQQVAAVVREHGFEQLMFSELGPDVDMGLRVLCDQIVPSL